MDLRTRLTNLPIIRKFLHLLEELGVILTFEYLVRRILSQLGIRFYRYILMAQPVPEKPWLPSNRTSAFDIREVTEQEYSLEWFPRPKEIVGQRFAQGAKCWVAFKQEKPVGCQWLVPGSYLEDEVRCRFVPLPEGSAAWDFDVYVTPDLRLGRLFLQLWDSTNAWMNTNGYRTCASRVDVLNLQSIRSHKRMRARCVGSAWFICCGRWQLAHASSNFLLSSSLSKIPVINIITN